MVEFWNFFASEESGQGMVEYGLIVGLISVVVIAVLAGIGNNLLAKFQEIETQLE